MKPATDKIASLPTQQSFHEEDNCCLTLEYDDVLLKSKIKLELKKQRRWKADAHCKMLRF